MTNEPKIASFENEPMIIEIFDLHYQYGNRAEALRGVDFHVHKGEVAFLLGHNGSGKTTLLQHFNGLLFPQRGQVRLKGTDIEELPDADIYRTVGLVLQDPNDQLFAPTVFEDVSFGPYNLGLSPAEVEKRATEALEEVEMLPFSDRGVHELSYGQKKKVALAGILAMNPEVLVLDEPTAGLDPTGEAEILRLISHLNQEHKLTVIMSTHNVDLAVEHAHTIWVLKQGQMALHGQPREVIRDKHRLQKLGLRLPMVSELVYRLQTDGYLSHEELPSTINGARHVIKQALSKKSSERFAANAEND